MYEASYLKMRFIDEEELTLYFRKYKKSANYERFLLSCRGDTLLGTFQAETVTWEEVDRYWADHFIKRSKDFLNKDDHFKLKKTVKDRAKKRIEIFLKSLIELERENLVLENTSTNDFDSPVEIQHIRQSPNQSRINFGDICAILALSILSYYAEANSSYFQRSN